MTKKGTGMVKNNNFGDKKTRVSILDIVMNIDLGQGDLYTLDI